MASVCFYFQVHQPFRLRRYSVFDNDHFYFDNEANREIMLKVADKCYRPATARILDLVKRHEGRFRVSYAISGVCLEQFAAWAPDVLDMFKELADTGACEFIGETSHHSPCFIFSRDEFDRQVDAHRAMVRELFGQEPTVFRNTELMYHDDLAWHMSRRGDHKAILCEGVDRILQHRSPNYVYAPPKFEGQPEHVINFFFLFIFLTFFFNGGREDPFEGQVNELKDSPKVATYDLEPKMAAEPVADAMVREIEAGKHTLLICNLAPPDMVGHTGMFDKAMEAAAHTDYCVGKVRDACAKAGVGLFILADHGNCETMLTPDGKPITSHSTSKVPFIAMVPADSGLKFTRADGGVADVAPTMLQYMGVDVPKEMTGKSFF